MTEASRRDVLAAAAVLTAVAAAPGAAAAQPAAPAVAVPATWDLTALYPTPQAWAAEREAVLKALPTIAQHKGKLGTSAAALKAAYTDIYDLEKRISRLGTYASLLADLDTGVAENQERRQLATTLYAQFGEAVAWVDPEVLKVGQARIDGFVRADPGLAPYRFSLANTLRRAPHTLGEEAEKVLAAAADPLSGPQEIRSQLVTSDIPWPEITLSTGQKVRLDAQGYSAHRQAPDRGDRKKVFDSFFGTYTTYRSSTGTALTSQLQGTIFRARSRNYPNALAAALSGDNIPEAVYRTLIAETNRGLPVLHRYFDVRRRLLGLPDMHYYDIYPSVTKNERPFSVQEAAQITLASTAPLGRQYVDLLARSIASPWADYMPKRGKTSGAYMNPGAYDVHPYLLLNHTNDYDSASTFTHEWGHAMHSLLSNQVQPYPTADYPTFTAEIASTLNEQLLARYMQAGARTREEKLFYLDAVLESFRGTYFRQAMFGEFELAIHETVERGEGLSGEKLSEMYLALLKKYHGPNVVIDPVYAIEWAYIPHFYYNFYVYQYATSIAASVFFDDQILKGGQAAAERYLNVLRAGGSDYPVDVLKRAGLDMTTPAPYQALIAKFSRTLDEVEALMA